VSKDGGPAFPSQYELPENQGLTLRDYFAAAALPVVWSMTTFVIEQNGTITKTIDEESIAHATYAMADALLKAREQ
jgi:hypothetical protein